MDLTHRSYQKELLDGDTINVDDLNQNLKELAVINTYLGGFAITIDGIAELLKEKNRSYHIVDIGCGGGDNMLAIAKWAAKNKIQVWLTGIDMKKDAIEYAQKNCASYPTIKFIESDYKLASISEPVDIIISSLFCHHLTNEQLNDCLIWMNENAKLGFIINDLERNKIAYFSIKWLTYFFSKSYLVKNDAALSVRRGFKKQELVKAIHQAGITNYKVRWKWAFRYLVTAITK